jgi:hypothetical protein
MLEKKTLPNPSGYMFNLLLQFDVVEIKIVQFQIKLISLNFHSNVAYTNLMKEEFLNWHRACLLMTADVSETESNVSKTESNVSESKSNISKNEGDVSKTESNISETKSNVTETKSNVSEIELNKILKEKLGFLNLVTEMLRTANPETVSSLEDILSEKLSSEAVHRLVTIQYQSLK